MKTFRVLIAGFTSATTIQAETFEIVQKGISTHPFYTYSFKTNNVTVASFPASTVLAVVEIDPAG
jgi:hypothetical protein